MLQLPLVDWQETHIGPLTNRPRVKTTSWRWCYLKMANSSLNSGTKDLKQLSKASNYKLTSLDMVLVIYSSFFSPSTSMMIFGETYWTTFKTKQKKTKERKKKRKEPRFCLSILNTLKCVPLTPKMCVIQATTPWPYLAIRSFQR